jgi:hypothetical protein
LYPFLRFFIAAASFPIRKPVVVLRLQFVILPLASALFPLAACGVVFTCVDAVCLLPYLYVRAESEREKEQFVALLTDYVVNKQF